MKKNKSAPSKNNFLNGLMKNHAAGWLVILAFMSVWMFVLGIVVGRGTAPINFNTDPLQKELADLKKAEIKKEISRLKVDQNSTQRTKNLKFYEDLKKTGDKKQRDRKKTEPSIEKKRKTKKQPNTNAGQKRFTIQVASFKDPKDAEKLATRLKKKGYSAYKIRVEIPEKGTWYRVRAGSFKSKEDASRIMQNLKREGFGAIVVNK